MSFYAFNNLLYFSPEQPLDLLIHRLVTFFTDNSGRLSVHGPRLKALAPSDQVMQLLQAASLEELAAYRVITRLGEIGCDVGFYGLGKHLTIDNTTFLNVSFLNWSEFSDLFHDPQQDPAYIDTFAQACIAFTEHMQPFLAPWGFDVEPGLAEFFSWFGQDPLKDRLGMFLDKWLTYMDPSVFSLWLERFPTSTPSYYKVITLATGAKAIFGNGYSCWNRNDDLERQAEWIQHSIERQPQIVGSNILLAFLQTGLAQLPPDPPQQATTEAKHAHYLLRRQTHQQVDAARLLWATALQRPGLVSVLHSPVGQTFDDLLATPDLLQLRATIVHIVADTGREWCVYTEQGDFDFDAADWSGPMGLWTRILALQRAAQDHPVDGQTPRVVLVAWRQLSTKVRTALQAQGVEVVPSTQLAPLLAY